MNKCMASKGGICRNVWAFGLKCDGYSSTCKLRPHYLEVEKTAMAVANSIREALGLKGEEK